MGGHGKVCRWWNFHAWTKWEDCTIPWIWFTDPAAVATMAGQRRYCENCGKKQQRKATT